MGPLHCHTVVDRNIVVKKKKKELRENTTIL